MLPKNDKAYVEMVKRLLPSLKRREKGPYAIFECFQEIPCNPCLTACRKGAVDIFIDINHLPIINYEKCNGCALCVIACPGLACFVIDETYTKTETSIKLPYELLPLPKAGQEVEALDRQGNVVGKAMVIRVQNHKKMDHTCIIAIAVLKEQSLVVRNIRY